MNATAGEIIVYGDEMISAMFFSTSNGKTETAKILVVMIFLIYKVLKVRERKKSRLHLIREQELTLEGMERSLGIEWNADMFKSLQLVRNPTGRVQKVVSTGFESNWTRNAGTSRTGIDRF